MAQKIFVEIESSASYPILASDILYALQEKSPKSVINVRVIRPTKYALDGEAVCVCGDELFAVNPDGKCAWCKLPRQ